MESDNNIHSNFSDNQSSCMNSFTIKSFSPSDFESVCTLFKQCEPAHLLGTLNNDHTLINIGLNYQHEQFTKGDLISSESLMETYFNNHNKNNPNPNLNPNPNPNPNPSGHFWVARDKETNKIIGQVGLQIISKHKYSPHTPDINNNNNNNKNNNSEDDMVIGELRRMGVSGEIRNKGVGSALIKALLKFAKEISKCNKIILTTLAVNTKAIHFYEKHGFKLSKKFTVPLPFNSLTEELHFDLDLVEMIQYL